MAYVPTEKQIEDQVAKAEAKEAKKLASQEAQGKDFINNGQGVIPEAYWKTLPGKTEEKAVA